MYQLTEDKPLIGVNVTMRVLPSTSISLSSLLMCGVFFGYASLKDFIARDLSG
ncbi:hypothetical protein D3C85_1753550 [compost metagenome]